MATTPGHFIPNFHFAQGNVYYSHTAVTFVGDAAISAATTLSGGVQFALGERQLIQMKNLTFTPPKSELEVINLMGVESTSVGAGVPVTGSFQNQVFDEKSWTEAILTGTLVFTAHNDGSSATALMPDLINAVTGTGQAISTTYHRHSFGDDTASQVRVTAGAIIIVMKNGMEEATLCMNHPYVNLGEIKPTGEEGHYEAEVEIKSLCKDTVLEIKDFD